LLFCLEGDVYFAGVLEVICAGSGGKTEAIKAGAMGVKIENSLVVQRCKINFR